MADINVTEVQTALNSIAHSAGALNLTITELTGNQVNGMGGLYTQTKATATILKDKLNKELDSSSDKFKKLNAAIGTLLSSLTKSATSGTGGESYSRRMVASMQDATEKLETKINPALKRIMSQLYGIITTASTISSATETQARNGTHGGGRGGGENNTEEYRAMTEGEMVAIKHRQIIIDLVHKMLSTTMDIANKSLETGIAPQLWATRGLRISTLEWMDIVQKNKIGLMATTGGLKDFTSMTNQYTMQNREMFGNNMKLAAEEAAKLQVTIRQTAGLGMKNEEVATRMDELSPKLRHYADITGETAAEMIDNMVAMNNSTDMQEIITKTATTHRWQLLQDTLELRKHYEALGLSRQAAEDLAKAYAKARAATYVEQVQSGSMLGAVASILGKGNLAGALRTGAQTGFSSKEEDQALTELAKTYRSAQAEGNTLLEQRNELLKQADAATGTRKAELETQAAALLLQKNYAEINANNAARYIDALGPHIKELFDKKVAAVGIEEGSKATAENLKKIVGSTLGDAITSIGNLAVHTGQWIDAYTGGNASLIAKWIGVNFAILGNTAASIANTRALLMNNVATQGMISSLAKFGGMLGESLKKIVLGGSGGGGDSSWFMGFTKRLIVAKITDEVAGFFGVGKDKQGKDLVINEEQDTKNWQHMGIMEKSLSGFARGVEKISGILGLDSLTTQAKFTRIQNETKYIKEKEEGERSTEAGDLQNEMLKHIAEQTDLMRQNNMLVQKHLEKYSEVENNKEDNQPKAVPSTTQRGVSPRGK